MHLSLDDEPVGTVETMHLLPGDTIIVTLPQALPGDLIEHVRSQVRDLFPGHRVVVVCGGTISVVRGDTL